MNKKTLIPILLIISFLSLAYAIYRSTAQRITTVENGHETVYGEPQHGLVLGLCILSGMCILGIVAIVISTKKEEVLTDSSSFGKKYI